MIKKTKNLNFLYINGQIRNFKDKPDCFCVFSIIGPVTDRLFLYKISDF